MRGALLAVLFAFSLGGSELIEANLNTTLVPSPLEYAALPDVVAAAPSAHRSFYMDYRDGSGFCTAADARAASERAKKLISATDEHG